MIDVPVDVCPVKFHRPNCTVQECLAQHQKDGLKSCIDLFERIDRNKCYLLDAKREWRHE